MAVHLDPVRCGADGLAVLLPEDSGVRDGVDSADQLHLIAGLGVDEHLLHLYLRLEQHSQIYVLKKLGFFVKHATSLLKSWQVFTLLWKFIRYKRKEIITVRGQY